MLEMITIYSKEQVVIFLKFGYGIFRAQCVLHYPCVMIWKRMTSIGSHIRILGPWNFLRKVGNDDLFEGAVLLGWALRFQKTYGSSTSLFLPCGYRLRCEFSAVPSSAVMDLSPLKLQIKHFLLLIALVIMFCYNN